MPSLTGWLFRMKLDDLAYTFRKLWQHPWQNWGLLLYSGTLTATVRVGLSLSSLSRVTKALRQLARTLPERTGATPQYRLRAAWAARAVGTRFLPDRPCLTQALVLQYLLLRRGDDAAQLRIGVTKDKDGGLQAHAWVDRNGRVLIGGTDAPDMYQEFEDLNAKISSPGASQQSS
jgi:hypothetical protein